MRRSDPRAKRPANPGALRQRIRQIRANTRALGTLATIVSGVVLREVRRQNTNKRRTVKNTAPRGE